MRCCCLQTCDELAAVLRLVQRRALPWFVLGSGSNLLVGDGGIRGIVVRLGGEFAHIEVASDGAAVIVSAGASASLPLLVAQAASAGADGCDALAGIPGSVGGALRMNAGTDRETGEFVRDVWVQTPTKPTPHAVSPQYFYRQHELGRATRSSPARRLRLRARIRRSCVRGCTIDCGAAKRCSRCNIPTPVRAFATRPAPRPGL